LPQVILTPSIYAFHLPTGIPAVIGVGEKLLLNVKIKKLNLDCANKKVEIIR
jgi:hypothetical protein